MAVTSESGQLYVEECTMWQRAKILQNEIEYLIGKKVWVKAERPRVTTTSEFRDIEGRSKSPKLVLETNIKHPYNQGVVLAVIPNSIELLSEFKEDREVPYISFREWLDEIQAK